MLKVIDYKRKINNNFVESGGEADDEANGGEGKMNNDFDELDFEAEYDEANGGEADYEGLTNEEVTYITLILYNINLI